MPYAGSGTAVEVNARCRGLIANGATWLSVAFDLPTRMGHDSDAPVAYGAVGRAGVAIDSIDDMRVLFCGIPLERISTSMTAGAPAAVLLLLYQLVAEEQGVSTGRLTGTIRDDASGGHRAGGRFLFPPGPSLRLFADVLTYCRAELPKWNVIPVPGDRGARVGAPPARESAHDPARERLQAERIAKLRAWRDQDRLDRRLQRVRKAATGDGNVLYPMKDALHASATIGEVCGVLREVWGVYRPAGAPGCERAAGPGTSFRE